MFDELLGGNMEKLSFSEVKTGLGLLAGKYGNIALSTSIIKENRTVRIEAEAPKRFDAVCYL